MQNLITVKDLMAILQVSRDTIYRWRKERSLPYKKIGRSVRYDLKDVQAWLDEQDDLKND